VQHTAIQGKEIGLDIGDLQTCANPCNPRFITRSWSRGKRSLSPLVGPLFLQICRENLESKEASAPRVRLTYCNPPQKQFAAGGRAEEGALFCILLRGVCGAS
jgi:hypothetical protein